MKIEEIYQIYKSHPEICTDTRQLKPGCFFIALKGEHFDGNDYVEQAIEKGAAYCLVSDQEKSNLKGCIFVEDTLVTMQKLATYHRKQFDIPIIAITGSNGKTTTKELLRDILKMKYRVHATVGNFNNHIGVPLTLLSMSTNTEIAIIEMGANHQGEIKELSKIAAPNYGFITNVGLAHLEGFGGLEGVQKGKKELFDYMNQNEGFFFINTKDVFLNSFPRNSSTLEITQICQSASRSHYLSFTVENDDGIDVVVQTNLFGDFNLPNISAALSIGKYFGVSFPERIEAIKRYQATLNRSQIIERSGNTIVLDAYNANPTSMKASITEFLRVFDQCVLILGNMLELGAKSDLEHQKLIDWLMNQDFKRVILVGEVFRKYKDHDQVDWFQNSTDAGNFLKKLGLKNESILLKGSRSTKLERIIEFL